MSPIKNVKFWFSALIGLWVLIIVATLGQRAANAQTVVLDLQPPFHFVQTSEPDRPLIAVRPPGETVILTETFGAGFNPVTQITGTLPLWRVIRNTTDTAGYRWGRVSDTAPVTFTNSAWSAITPALLHPGVDEYPAGQDTWLLYGPIDLSRYMYATLSFEYYLDATSSDRLIWGVTADGVDVIGDNRLGGNGGAQWITGTYQFDRALWGSNAVYIAFAFQSGATPNGHGAFIRNVRLNAEPFHYVFLPVALNNYPATPTPTPTITPTPTQTPMPSLYGYTFDEGTVDLNHWGGAFYNTGNTKYGQCLPGQCTMHYTTPHGNPGTSLRLYTNGLYSFIASSPNDIAPDNFDLDVDISPWVIYPRWAGCAPWCPEVDLGDWYGIIFNASDDTFGANPSQFAYNKTYYRVYFYNIDAVKPITIKLERCDGASSSADNTCHSLGSHSLSNANFIGNASGFDTVHIERRASGSIQVYLNGTLMISANDATYTGSSQGKYGVFIFSWTLNATQNPPTGYEMQVDFDNVKTYSR